MSATTITQTITTSPKRSFRRRYTVAQGTAYQVWGLIGGSMLLALATQLKTGAGALMIAGFVTVYLNCHALAHYLAGRRSAFASAAMASGAPTIPRSIRPGSAS